MSVSLNKNIGETDMTTRFNSIETPAEERAFDRFFEAVGCISFFAALAISAFL